MGFRFDVKRKAGTEYLYVYDLVMGREVPGQGFDGSHQAERDEAYRVRDSLNQRVTNPELTRADGKLVSV